MNHKTNYTAQDLASLQLSSIPQTKAGVIIRAKKENWQSRPRQGKGGGREYAFDSLPAEVQAEIQIKLAREAAEKQLPPTHTQVKPHAGNYLPEVIWSGWEKATTKQQEKAKEKVMLCFALDDLHQNGMPLMQALDKVASECNAAKGSLKRWYYRVRKFERSDWMPLLLGSYKDNPKRTADFTPEAWEAFKADYFRPERPQFGTCYERLKLLAIENDWVIPSVSSIKRKINKEIPKAQQILLREGEHKLSQLYPHLQRSVTDLEALEWINGDGYQHNVFVRWHNGDIVRPKTWLWQDVRTRKILAYRTDISENSDTIRLALMDVVSKYGIPKTLTIDNTRAAANKWMTGGVPNRYRFKVKEDDPVGIIPLLGIELKWTSVQFGKGHGQAKPIERAFSHGGLGETVDKHPLLAGFHAGENVLNKPDNYNAGKDGASYEDFITALEAGIALWNNREGRKTEVCDGVYSFNQVFERDYAKATIKRASDEQMRLLMLMSEAVTLKANGTFELSCGGKVFGRKNRYEASELIGTHHKKVVVKFDPTKLHETVWVYTLDGLFLAEAICTEKAAFGDKAKGREHDKARKQFVKHQKAAAKAQQTMTAEQVAELMPETEDEAPLIPTVVEMVRAEGNALRKEQVIIEDEVDDWAEPMWKQGISASADTVMEDDEDEISDFDKDFSKAIELMKQQQG